MSLYYTRVTPRPKNPPTYRVPASEGGLDDKDDESLFTIAYRIRCKVIGCDEQEGTLEFKTYGKFTVPSDFLTTPSNKHLPANTKTFFVKVSPHLAAYYSSLQSEINGKLKVKYSIYYFQLHHGEPGHNPTIRNEYIENLLMTFGGGMPYNMQFHFWN